MTVSLDAPPRFHLAEREGPRLTLRAENGAAVHLFVLEAEIIRVLLAPHGELSMPRTWAIAPGEADVALEGRDRFDLTGFSGPAFELSESEDRLVIETAALRLTVKLTGFVCRWEMKLADGWRQVAKDRPTQAYNLGWWDEKTHHYLVLAPSERFYGLGERAGPMDRAGRRYRLTNVDAMGYSAATSDPLYKHIPFYITLSGQPAAAFGIFYDTLADCSFDFGQERSNYHGRFRSFVAEAGDLDYYVIAGPSVAEVTRRFTWLTGRPAFLPRWGLGYSGSTMSYTDAPDAQARMAEFLAACEAHDILCDSFHLSSGYTSIGPRRYVFHWNRDKFPDPAAFVASYRDSGVRLVANIKPVLLADHPLFGEAQERGLLIGDVAGRPAMMQFWDGVGAYLDFTNPDTLDWWKGQVTTALLDFGVASTWNDNNEFEITSPRAQAAMFGHPRPAQEAKPLQTLLMMRASAEAQRAYTPEARPYLVSRAGSAGMQRYVQTWSGDNATSWETLKFNLKMGLGLALSGVSNSGHDIGGFAGPAPNAELFVRWVAAGVFMPRFSIHSWNDDGTANEPWMHADATPAVRALIALRYRLMPYLYDLTWRHHRDFAPITRPTFHDFPGDPACLAENDEMLMGRSLLVPLVVEPGQSERQVYLPAGCGWIDVWTGARFEGGTTVTLPAPWETPPLLAREGCAIPLNIAQQHFAHRADERAFWVFPHPGAGRFEAECYEDDGESAGGEHGFWRLILETTDLAIGIRVERPGPARPTQKWLTLLFPPGEARAATLEGGRLAEDGLAEGCRRLVVRFDD